MSKLKALYDEQGYVIVQDLVVPEAFPELIAACDRAVNRTREGSWTLRRVIGKQFPPFGDDHPDSWGVQHIMHPDLGEHAFDRWYTSTEFTDIVCELLECEEGDLQMELFNLLINPLSHEFALRWHRDDIRGDATEEEEREALGLWHYGVQWNTALYEDKCLYLVPGSHLCPRTSEQRALSMTMDPPENPFDMPGAVQLTLKAGETVFYNSNLLHCATYSTKAKRATLHGTMGNAAGGHTRARNILQHRLEWMKEERFRDGLDERGKKMLDKLVRLQEETTEDVGFSLMN
ncbi:hypothetical protein C8J56DRAFT_793539 [Mycena floridula]|nr:hypothetical protein C8J56DRAFT_793539 [Mycena floridula]